MANDPGTPPPPPPPVVAPEPTPEQWDAFIAANPDQSRWAPGVAKRLLAHDAAKLREVCNRVITGRQGVDSNPYARKPK